MLGQIQHRETAMTQLPMLSFASIIKEVVSYSWVYYIYAPLANW